MTTKVKQQDDDHDISASHGAERLAMLSTAMDPTRVKKLLYQREPKMATLPLKSQKLVGTTCALFLRNLLDRTFKYSPSSPKDGDGVDDGAHNDNNDSNDIIITFKCVSQAMATMTADTSLPKSLVDAALQTGEKRRLDDVSDFTVVNATRQQKSKAKEQKRRKVGAAMEDSNNNRLLDESSEKGSMAAALSASVLNGGASGSASGSGQQVILEDDDDYD